MLPLKWRKPFWLRKLEIRLEIEEKAFEEKLITTRALSRFRSLSTWSLALDFSIWTYAFEITFITKCLCYSRPLFIYSPNKKATSSSIQGDRFPIACSSDIHNRKWILILSVYVVSISDPHSFTIRVMSCGGDGVPRDTMLSWRDSAECGHSCSLPGHMEARTRAPGSASPELVTGAVYNRIKQASMTA